MNPLIKGLWSILIVYLLIVVVVLPNNGSILAQKWGRYLAPVANQFGINNAWQFFSPAPAPTMYLSYSIDRGEAAENETESPTYYFPSDAAEGHISPNYNRMIYAMRFMVISPERIERFFMPWVCRQHPDAVMVNVQHVVEPVPEMDTLGQGYRQYVDKLKFEPMQLPCVREGENS